MDLEGAHRELGEHLLSVDGWITGMGVGPALDPTGRTALPRLEHG